MSFVKFFIAALEIKCILYSYAYIVVLFKYLFEIDHNKILCMMLIIIKEAVPAYCQVLRHNRKKIGKVIHDCDKKWFAEKCGVDNI